MKIATCFLFDRSWNGEIFDSFFGQRLMINQATFIAEFEN